jgi:hypothetical protein
MRTCTTCTQQSSAGLLQRTKPDRVPQHTHHCRPALQLKEVALSTSFQL